MREKRTKVLIALMLMSLGSLAQTVGYKFKADIIPVSEPGLYNILLTPNLKAHVKTDYSDFRIVDSSGKWVSHLVRYPGSEKTNEEMLWDLRIAHIEDRKNASEITVVADNRKIYNLTFRIRNTNVERWGNLTGSEDSINWFVINDSIQLRPSVSDEVGESEFAVNFPANIYRFYKLSVTNNGKAPYAISKVITSYPADEARMNDSLQPFENPAASILQKDSGKISYITVTQKGGFHIDRIQLRFGGLKYFNRRVSLFVPSQGTQEYNRASQLLTSFTVSNNSSLNFKVPLFKDSTFYLLVYNDDNPPLRMEQVRTFSNAMVATVYLEKNIAYRVVMNNEKAFMPNYDLRLKDIDITRQLPVASTGKVLALQAKEDSKSPWRANKLVLWLAILAAASALTFFTLRLVKDMGRSTNSIS